MGREIGVTSGDFKSVATRFHLTNTELCLGLGKRKIAAFFALSGVLHMLIVPANPVLLAGTPLDVHLGRCMALVLLVDDDFDSSAALAGFLSKSGHTVQHVPDGRQALASVIELLPDVVVLDLKMPHMSGVGFLEVV